MKSIILLSLIACFGLAAFGSSEMLDPAQYYIFPMGDVVVEVQSLSQAAQAAEYAVITYSGNTIVALQGTSPATENIESLLASPSLLVLDGQRFYLHAEGPMLAYTMRPAAGGIELVVSPSEEIGTVDALTSILVELEGLGIQSSDIDLSCMAFPKESLKGPAVPEGVALDSVLYGLVVAEDWFQYASMKGLTLLGLSIEIVAEKIPGGTLPEAFASYVDSETEQLARLILPIDQLVPLAKLESIGYVRLPYRPVAP